MVVKTQCNGREIVGLYIGAANARRHFPRGFSAIDLRLGELQIQCTLPATFWQDVPEIRDPRLCEWLEFKVFHERDRRAPISLAMERCGMNSFMLRPATVDEEITETAMDHPVAKMRGHA
jgi:hypothetical protein